MRMFSHLLSTYGFAHAKFKKSIFKRKVLELVDDFGIILNDFQSRFNSTINIWVKFIWVENPNIPGIQPIHIKPTETQELVGCGLKHTKSNFYNLDDYRMDSFVP